jgi:hypothetical protein
LALDWRHQEIPNSTFIRVAGQGVAKNEYRRDRMRNFSAKEDEKDLDTADIVRDGRFSGDLTWPDLGDH